mgnify:CR=1 FL=1
MSQLAHDLAADWESLQEANDKGEVIKGLMVLGRIAGEVIGMIMLIIGAMKVLTVVTGGIAALGLPWAANAVVQCVRMYGPRIAQQYTEMSRDERRQLRSAMKFLGIGADIFS